MDNKSLTLVTDLEGGNFNATVRTWSTHRFQQCTDSASLMAESGLGSLGSVLSGESSVEYSDKKGVFLLILDFEIENCSEQEATKPMP